MRMLFDGIGMVIGFKMSLLPRGRVNASNIDDRFSTQVGMSGANCNEIGGTRGIWRF